MRLRNCLRHSSLSDHTFPGGSKELEKFVEHTTEYLKATKELASAAILHVGDSELQR